MRIRHLTLAISFLSFSLFTQAQANRTTRPNIIYIFADDLGYGELGCYGQQKIKTPHLDQMAKEGILFSDHYSSAPVCAPARCMLLTGKHAGHAYIRGNYELGDFSDDKEGGQMPLPENIFTIPVMLKKAGYVTGMVGKWGLGMPFNGGSPLQHGFDYYYGVLDQKQAHNYYPTHLWENDKWDSLQNPRMNVHKKIDSATATDADFNQFIGKDYAPARMTEKAMNFIAKNKTRPFFLYLPYTLPHLSLLVPEEYVNKYKGQFNETPYYGQNGYAACKYPLSTYAAMITYLDDQVGLIMEKIKKLGLDKNTIIMFSSDNGTTFTGGVDAKFFNSSMGLRGLKMELYEGGIRMPFITRWPGKIQAGIVTSHPSAQYDLMATLAELTRQPLKNTDGISFLPTLLGNYGEQKKHAFLYFEYPENGGQVAIRFGNYKGIKLNLKKDPNAPWLLYDLAADRSEKRDIAADHPDIIKKLDSILKEQHTCSHLRDWEIIDPKF